MAKAGQILECACGCGLLFKAQKDGQRFKSKSCARTYEWRARNPPLSEEQIAAVLRAVEIELRRSVR